MYSRYANPRELISMYTKNRRFGKLVEKVVSSENKRKQEEAEKENEDRLLMMYCHSMPDKSFNDWKKDYINCAQSKISSQKDENLTDGDIEKIINDLFE